MSKKKQYKLYDLYNKASQKKQDSQESEEKQLKLAIELSKKEQIKEQKKLFELLQQQSTTQDDEDDWFQTVSSRVQPKKKVKKEPESLVIEDLSKFLIKQDPEEEQESMVVENLSALLKREDSEEQELVIDNLTAFLESDQETDPIPRKKTKKTAAPKQQVAKKKGKRTQKEETKVTKRQRTKKTVEQQPETSLMPNYSQTEKNIKCPVCDNWFDDETSAQEHLNYCNLLEEPVKEPIEVDLMKSDANESDCSVVDLCNPDADMDDGYLSPLEGFSNVLDIQGDNPYLAQFQHKTSKRKKSTPTTNPRSTAGSRSNTRTVVKSKKSYWKRRPRKKNT